MQEAENFVRLTANAGIYVRYGGKTFLIDGLHDRYTNAFSSVPESILTDAARGVPPFEKIDFILYTHDHPDHYSEKWTRMCLKSHPNAILLTPVPYPENSSRVNVLRNNSETFEWEGVTVTAQKLTHDGDRYKDVPNYGYIINADGANLLTLGDAGFDADKIRAFAGDRAIDVAFLNFPFASLAAGRRIVESIIRPKKAIYYHLPFADKDVNGYRASAERVLERYKHELPDCALLYNENQTISL